MCCRVLFVSFVFFPLAANAQKAMPTEPTGWQRVQALSPATKIRIASDIRNADCFVVSVSDADLTCSRSSTANNHPLVFPRPGIKNIKFSRKGHSATFGMLVGIGAGAAIGAVVGIAVNHGDKGSIPHVDSTGKPAAAGAAVGVLLLGGTGAAIGYGTDLFAGPLIYRR